MLNALSVPFGEKKETNNTTKCREKAWESRSTLSHSISRALVASGADRQAKTPPDRSMYTACVYCCARAANRLTERAIKCGFAGAFAGNGAFLARTYVTTGQVLLSPTTSYSALCVCLHCSAALFACTKRICLQMGSRWKCSERNWLLLPSRRSCRIGETGKKRCCKENGEGFGIDGMEEAASF